MKEPFLGSQGIENLRFAFAGRNRPSGECRFPQWGEVEFGCSSADPAVFIRQVLEDAASVQNIDQASAIEQCEIAPGLAVFIEFEWDNHILTRCSAQAVAIPNGSIADLFLNEPPTALYYRFDFSVKERGNLFDHPFPHVHTHYDGSPRFPCLPKGDAFPLFYWLEFLMLNHHYNLWERWAINQFRFSADTRLSTPDREPEDFLLAFPQQEDWNAIPEPERATFITAAKTALRNATAAKANDFPKLPAELLSLNYWSE